MAEIPTIGAKQLLKESLKTKSGIAAFAMLATLLIVVLILPFYAPGDVVRDWGRVDAWTDNPRNAAPEWVDVFTSERLSRTIILEQEDFRKASSDPDLPIKVILNRGVVVFEYDTFPSELFINIIAKWADRIPNIRIFWERPDDLDLTLLVYTPQKQAPDANVIAISTDTTIKETVRQWALSFGADDTQFVRPEVTLFAEQGPGMLNPRNATPLQGRYVIRFETIAFEQTDDVDVRFGLLGTIHGFAGTDDRRRDLLVGLLWGAPVALAFGVVAALATVFSQVLLGVFSAYVGGRTDEFIQRGADFFLIIPILPILILFGAFYSPGILSILIIVIVFSLLGSATKVVRSIALQVKEEQYVESAESYGASRTRIVFKHIFPRTLPYSFALIALAVPSFIFLEAALSFLGLGDPLLPTWGSIMGEAQRAGALLNGLWWWISFPAVGILFTTVAFAMLGYSFDKILNPRLREE
ncbi:MAG: ABC transporter permease [Thermoplasmata archaeon]